MRTSATPTPRTLLRPNAPGGLRPPDVSTAPSGSNAADGPTDVDPPADVEALMARLDTISIAHPSAVRVLMLVDDPNVTIHKVGEAIETDPAFTAQIMRLANSAYYGLSGRVGNINFAVTIIGFAAVRSLAAMAAAGVTASGVKTPAEFWAHAASTAAGASAVASRFGIPTADCFAAGLLHDVGMVFLQQIDPDRHNALLVEHGSHGAGLVEAERRVFGMSHAEAAAHVLRTWKFPQRFVDAVAGHHDPEADPFAQAVAVGEALAIAGVGDDPVAEAVLERSGIEGEDRATLIEYTVQRAREVLASLPH